MKIRKIIFFICLLLLFIPPFPDKVHAVSVSASGAILMEQHSGRVLFEYNAHEVHRIASITKVMTAIIAIESGKLEEEVIASKRAVYTEGSSIYLQVGEKMKLEDLLYGLMLRSGNDAAVAIAEHIGGSMEGFVFLMNQKAKEIGMLNTEFSNPHGLDHQENHYSTAYDMALLTRYAMQNETFRKISGTKVYKFQRESGIQTWYNKNRLLTEKYRYSTGGKTGFTKRAGRTLISTASKGDMELIAVTLNAPDDWNDHINLFEYAFKTYKNYTILEQGKLPIKPEGTEDNTELYLKHSFQYPLTENEKHAVRVEYQLLHPRNLAKLDSGKAGEVIVYLYDEPILKDFVYIQKRPKEKDWWQMFIDKLFNKSGG